MTTAATRTTATIPERMKITTMEEADETTTAEGTRTVTNLAGPRVATRRSLSRQMIIMETTRDPLETIIMEAATSGIVGIAATVAVEVATRRMKIGSARR